MMRHRIFLTPVLSLIVIFLSGTALSAQTAPSQTRKTATKKTQVAAAEKLPLEAKAMEILKGTSDRLAAAHSLSFTAVELFEKLSRQAAPVAYTTKYEVLLQRPDKLRVLMPADGPASDFYYNGKFILAYDPAANLLATAEAPSTLEGALEKADHLADIYFPFADLIVTNPYSDLAPGLKHAYYIGQSKVVGGTTTDIVAYVTEGVFIQMWVGAEDKMPRLIRAIYLDDPEQLRHELAFSDWNLAPTIEADSFAPPNAAGVKPMPFASPYVKAAASANAPAKTKPVKKQ